MYRFILLYIFWILDFEHWNAFSLKRIHLVFKNRSIFFGSFANRHYTIVDIVILRKWNSVTIGGMLIGLMKGLANCLLYWNGGFCLILSLKNSFLLLSRELLLYCLFYLWFYDYYESDTSKMVFDKLYYVIVEDFWA